MVYFNQDVLVVEAPTQEDNRINDDERNGEEIDDSLSFKDVDGYEARDEQKGSVKC